MTMAKSENDHLLSSRVNINPPGLRSPIQKSTIYKKIVIPYYEKMLRLKSHSFIVDWQMTTEKRTEGYEGNE